ncbi:amidase [Marinosulfonomonas sp. PRT-SC04]|nr:amidase [Marinosulfonomonas sp. PRT-SC04]
MADIVNLNRARKTLAREDAKAQADANAVKFGRTKASRIAEAAQSDMARKMLDQHEMDGHEMGEE